MGALFRFRKGKTRVGTIHGPHRASPTSLILILPTTASATEHASLSSTPTSTPSTSFRPRPSRLRHASCKPHRASRAANPSCSPSGDFSCPPAGFGFMPPFPLRRWGLCETRQNRGLEAMSATMLKNLDWHRSSIFGANGAAAEHTHHGRALDEIAQALFSQHEGCYGKRGRTVKSRHQVSCIQRQVYGVPNAMHAK